MKCPFCLLVSCNVKHRSQLLQSLPSRILFCVWVTNLNVKFENCTNNLFDVSSTLISCLQTTDDFNHASGSGNTSIMIVLGERHTCSLLVNGGILCWGYNNFGQLGINSSLLSYNVPMPVMLGAGANETELLLQWCIRAWMKFLPGTVAVSLASGRFHVCAIVQSGQIVARYVMCWGSNQFGQLGTGTTINMNYPAITYLKSETGNLHTRLDERKVIKFKFLSVSSVIKLFIELDLSCKHTWIKHKLSCSCIHVSTCVYVRCNMLEVCHPDVSPTLLPILLQIQSLLLLAVGFTHVLS